MCPVKPLPRSCFALTHNPASASYLGQRQTHPSVHLYQTTVMSKSKGKHYESANTTIDRTRTLTLERSDYFLTTAVSHLFLSPKT